MMSEPTTIRIHIDYNRVIVRPATAAVKEALSATELSFEAGGETGCEPVYLTEHFYTESGDRLLIRHGLVPRVVSVLEDLGHGVEIVDERQWPLRVRPVTEPAFSWVSPELTRAVCGAEGGQLLVPSTGAVATIADMCRLYPYATVLILAMGKADARGLSQALRLEVKEPIGLRAGNACRRERIVVGTIPVAKQYDSDSHDVVILANVSDLLGNRTREVVEYVSSGPTRLYAVVRENERMRERDELALERLVGPRIYGGTTPERTPRPRVWFVTGTDTEVGGSTGGGKDEAGHDYRVARIAEALADGDAAFLNEVGLYPDHDVETLLQQRVAILVNTAEHARRIGSRLPYWRVRTRQEPGTEEWGPAIVTTCCAAHAGLQADTLVVTAGGQMNVPALLKATRGRSTWHTTIVDIFDNRNKRDEADAWVRRQLYTKSGWTVQAPIGVDHPANGRKDLRKRRPAAGREEPASGKEVVMR